MNPSNPTYKELVRVLHDLFDCDGIQLTNVCLACRNQAFDALKRAEKYLSER